MRVLVVVGAAVGAVAAIATLGLAARGPRYAYGSWTEPSPPGMGEPTGGGR
jgi:hypothetical protein